MKRSPHAQVIVGNHAAPPPAVRLATLLAHFFGVRQRPDAGGCPNCHRSLNGLNGHLCPGCGWPVGDRTRSSTGR